MLTAAVILMLETGEMREGEQSSREQMRPLAIVCMNSFPRINQSNCWISYSHTLNVTRGQGEVSLNRNNSDCIPETSGLWRCDVPDSSGKNQSIYIYISNGAAIAGKQLILLLY